MTSTALVSLGPGTMSADSTLIQFSCILDYPPGQRVSVCAFGERLRRATRASTVRSQGPAVPRIGGGISCGRTRRMPFT